MSYLHFNFHSRESWKVGMYFTPLFVSLHLCSFLTRSPSLENSPVVVQAKIFLFASAPTHTDLALFVKSYLFWASPLKSSRSAGQVRCVAHSYLGRSGCGRLWCLFQENQCLPQIPDLLLPVPWLRGRWRRQWCPFFGAFSKIFQAADASQSCPKEGWGNSVLQNPLDMDTVSLLGTHLGGQAWAGNDHGKVYDLHEHFCYLH